MSRIAGIMVMALVMVALLCGVATAQKSAFIDSDKIQQNYQSWVKAQEQFNTELQAWEEEAGQMEQELREMLDEYERQKLILSADKKAEREAAISAKDQALASFTRDISAPGGRAERRQMELVKPLYEKITAAIEKVAIDEGYNFVFNSNGLAYAKKNLEITDKVLEVLDNEE